MSSPALLSATAMSRLIRDGQLSARELLEAHLERIDRLNPKLNAIVTLDVDRARRNAATADEAQARGEALGPLHGLPVAHKDLQPVKGMRTTFGSRIFQDFIPEEDSLLVGRIRKAGAIAIGKTNTPEFGAGSQTYNDVFGTTLNPWDPAKTCGGSSGGAAVALATRMLALADGSDLGGSLRNPASFCGVVGLRPSPGRVPAWPVPMAWSPLSVEGPMARTVADLALFLSAIAGPDPRAPLSLDSPGEGFAAPLGRDFKGGRVAWWKDLGGIPVAREVREITNAQRARFEALGCIVEEAEPDFEGADTAFRALRFHATGLRLGNHRKEHPHWIKDTLLWELEQADRLTAGDIGAATLKQTEIFHRMRRFMERYDFFVLPVSQVPPFDVTQHYPAEIDGVKMETYIDWMKSCYYISMTACPALSVPCGFTGDGLPIGIQIVGRHRDDWGLLQMGHAFEQTTTIDKELP
ncbi:MAG TPA: amidase [Bryobacteraceae bacterium]|nr:amidase [Bryobacteraceae bacterium]